MKREYLCIFPKFLSKKFYMSLNFFFSWNKEKYIFSWNRFFSWNSWLSIIMCSNGFHITFFSIEVFCYRESPSWYIYNRNFGRYMTVVILKNLWIECCRHDYYLYIFSIFHKHSKYFCRDTKTMYLI